MSNNEDIVQLIREVFAKTDRDWLVGGNYVEPLPEHIEKMLETASKVQPNDIFESGGLIVVNDKGHLDVYVHVGTLDKSSS